MSLPLMAAAWASGVPPIDRLVLVALADWANERGQCWPSMPTISGKTGVDVRTARRVMARLEAEGHLTTDRKPGKGILYTIHPGQADPGHSVPGQAAPRTENTLTPDTVSPNTPRTTIKKKRATPSPSTRDAYPMPEGVDPQHWRDFLANRVRRRMANTPSAHKSLMDALRRHADDEWTIPRLIQHAAERGWGGIYPPTGGDHDQRHHTGGQPRRGTTTNAYLEAFHRTGTGNEFLPD